MGRPRVKVIDDSQPAEEPKKVQPKPEKKAKDSLVAQLQEELGIATEEPKKAAPKADEMPKAEEKKEAEEPKPKEEAKSAKKAPKKVSSKPRSKKYQEKLQTLETELKPEDAEDDFNYKQAHYKLAQAIELVKKSSYSKFDGTLEAHINTRQTGLRGLISLPYVSGKKVRVMALGKGAEESGADVVGDDATLDEIAKGKLDFDILVCTPDWMPKLAKVAKVLGPRGLMPNPKSGTIATDLKKAIDGFKEGKTEYKTEAKGKVIHLGLGKLTQPTEELEANIKILLQTLGKSRVAKVTLAPTMGPSVKLDLTSI